MFWFSEFRIQNSAINNFQIVKTTRVSIEVFWKWSNIRKNSLRSKHPSTSFIQKFEKNLIFSFLFSLLKLLKTLWESHFVESIGKKKERKNLLNELKATPETKFQKCFEK